MPYIGLFPYIFVDKPVKVGPIEFIPVKANEINTRSSADDNRHLKTTIGFFKDYLGKPRVNATYFIVDAPNKGIIDSRIDEILTCIHLFRFSLLSSENSRYSVEQTRFYFLEIPPLYEISSGDNISYACYRCFVNLQHFYYARTNIPMYPPYPNFRTSNISTSDLYNLEQIQNKFFKNSSGLTDPDRERIIRAIELYNQTFQRNHIIDERDKVNDMSIAFEILLDLPSENIAEAFFSRVQALLGNSAELSSWCDDFYNTVSRMVHGSKKGNLLYKHPHAGSEQSILLNEARKIFMYSVDSILTDVHGAYTDNVKMLLTSNVVYLDRIKKAKNYDELKSRGLLSEISQLRPSNPVGNKQDIINLGILLLQSYKNLYLTKENKYLPTIDNILDFKDPDITKLGALYFKVYMEYEFIYSTNFAASESRSKRQPPIPRESRPTRDLERIRLEQAIISFTQFASFALSKSSSKVSRWNAPSNFNKWNTPYFPVNSPV